jgi:hypothetical protein
MNTQTEQSEINKYIVEPEDFLNLPENIQDKLTYNSCLQYIPIWDKLDYEHKIQIIMFNHTFDYVTLWDKLGTVEKHNVIQYTSGFDWKKYTPKPNKEILNILLTREDFFAEDFWDDLSYENKLRVCCKKDFVYQDFWDRLTDNLKIEIIKRNQYFNPKPYFKELQDTIADDYNENKLHGKDSIKKTMLDIYCERKNGHQYDSIWDELDVQQKMTIAVKNNDFVVGDKTDELYDLFKNYPFKMLDYLEKKIKTKPYFGQKLDICINDLDLDIKELIIKIIKSFHIIDYDNTLRKEVVKGDTTSVTIEKELMKHIPFCIIKIEDDQNENFVFTNMPIKKGYYLYKVMENEYTKIIDYSLILREAKLERLLNNNED